VTGLELRVAPGDFIALLGPNGVGKTLTLLTLAGLRAAAAGDVRLAGAPVAGLTRQSIARRLGMLLQHQSDPFPTTVLETALLGRHASRGLWRWETAQDRERARAALRAMDLSELEQRAADTLSGGERRRLAMAMLIAQDPEVLLLDEPLNHLDPQHRLTLLDCVASLCGAGKAAIASLHDPWLAAQYASHVLMLYGDGRWRFGPTPTVLTAELLGELYGTPFTRVQHGDQPVYFPLTRRS
jgi:iron complex transport system ATP-binding protein